MSNFKEVLSDWSRDIVFGLPAKDCPQYLFDWYELLDDSYIQYYLLYLGSKGQFTREVLNLSSKELYETITELSGNTTKGDKLSTGEL